MEHRIEKGCPPLVLAVGGPCGGGKTEGSFFLEALLSLDFPGIQRLDLSRFVRGAFDRWMASRGTPCDTLNDEEEKQRRVPEIDEFSWACMRENPRCWIDLALAAVGHKIVTGLPRTEADESALQEQPGVVFLRICASPAVCARRIGEELYDRRSQTDFERYNASFPGWDIVVCNEEDDPEKLRSGLVEVRRRIVEVYRARAGIEVRGIRLPAERPLTYELPPLATQRV